MNFNSIPTNYLYSLLMRDSNTIEATIIQEKWGLSVTEIKLERYLNINGRSKHFLFFSILVF